MALKMLPMLTLLSGQVSSATCGLVLQGPQNRKSGSNKCHWLNHGQQPSTDNKRGLDASLVLRAESKELVRLSLREEQTCPAVHTVFDRALDLHAMD